MPFTEMIVGIAAGLFFLVGFMQLVKFASMVMLHGSIRKLIKRDPATSERLLAAYHDAPRVDERGDDRLGVILVAAAIAIVFATLIVSDPSWMRHGLAAACFPGVVGAALWIRARSIQKAEQAADAAVE